MSDRYDSPGCGGDAAAYVLGALGAEEQTAYERHLAGCAVCQDEVDSLRGVVDVLALTPTQYRTPKRLRRRISVALADEVRAGSPTWTRLRAGGAVELGGRGSGTRGWLSGGGITGGGGSSGGGYRPGLVGAVAAVVLVLVVVVVGLTAGHSGRSVRSGAGANVWTASVGDAQVILSAGHGELVVHRLTTLGADSTYEVWLKRGGGAPEPTRTLFNVSASGDGAVDLPSDVAGASELMVTREPAGGTAVPTTAPLIVDHLG